jgi:hypothetical protein
VGKWGGDIFVVYALGFHDLGWLDVGGHIDVAVTIIDRTIALARAPFRRSAECRAAKFSRRVAHQPVLADRRDFRS